MDSLHSAYAMCVDKTSNHDLASFLSDCDFSSYPASPSLRGKNHIRKEVCGDMLANSKMEENAFMCGLPTENVLMDDKDVWSCCKCQYINSIGREWCGLCGNEQLIGDVLSCDNEMSFRDDSEMWSSFSFQDLLSDNTSSPCFESVSLKLPEMPNDVMLSTASGIPLRVSNEVTSSIVHGGSPKSECSSSPFQPTADIFSSYPAGSSPLNGSDKESVCNGSEFDGTRGCRAASVSLDSSIGEEDDDSVTMQFSTQAGPITCPQAGCGTVCPDYASFQLHFHQHQWGPHQVTVDENGVSNFSCSHEGCTMVTTDKKLLRKHMLSHREKVFACHYPDCERKFYERAKLKRHFLVHTGEKPFVCPFEQCGKRFGYNANLKTHLRTHTGSRPFACTVSNCRRRFAQASNRNNHVLTHLKGGDGFEDTNEYEGEPMDAKKPRSTAGVKKERNTRKPRSS